MFFISHEKKIAVMLIACMCLTLLQMNLPIKDANTFLSLSFLLSEVKNITKIIRKINNKPIINILLIIIFSCLIAIIFSPHLHTQKEAYSFIRAELMTKYLALVYAFISIWTEQKIKTVINITVIPMFILTLFGVVNLIEHHSSFVTEMMSNLNSESLNDIYELAGEKYELSDRFRVQAMFFNPFNYGYICVLSLVMYIYGYGKNMIGKPLFVILCICCAYGIFMCGARTVIFCAICGVSSFILFAYKLKKSMFRFLSVLLFFIVAYLTIPAVNERISMMTTMFTDIRGEEVGGSTIEMRSIQFATVLSYIQDNYMFGRGVNFFKIDLGYAQGKTGLLDTRLMGLEGVYMIYLLERGFVGYILYLSVWISLLIYFVRSRRQNKQLSAFGMSVWIIYTLFANMTGELSSVYPTLLVLGCIMGVIYNEKTHVRSS